MHFSQIVSVLAVFTATTLAAPSPKRNHVQVQARATVEPRQPFNPYHSAHRFAATAEKKKRASNHGRDAAPSVEKRKMRKRGGKCAARTAAAAVAEASSVSSTVASASSTVASSTPSATDYYVPSATESATESSTWVDPSSAASSSDAAPSSTLNVQYAAVDDAWSSSSASPTTSTAASSSSAAWSSDVVQSSSAAPATTSAASGGDWKTGGHATWYQQNGNAGACGWYKSDSDHVIAINGVGPSSYWTDYSKASPDCGRWVTIENTNNGKTVTAMVADVCPTCTGNGESIDLSIGAFQSIASLDEGLIDIRWRWN